MLATRFNRASVPPADEEETPIASSSIHVGPVNSSLHDSQACGA